MSANCNITGLMTNNTSYSFQLISCNTSSGYWNISPQPIPANPSTFTFFQGIGVSGTATGAVGQMTYKVLDANLNDVGTLSISYDDPYSGDNSCSGSFSGISSLSISNDCPDSGSTFTVNFTIS